MIRAILEALGPEGTLVMPAESPHCGDPADWDDPRVRPEWHATIREHLPPFDPRTTSTTMGAIPEAFRTYPGTLRSDHPLVSVCARGPRAVEIVADHPLDFGEGPGTPFEALYRLDGRTLLLGVGFDRCTALHYAESLTEARRTTTHRVLIVEAGERRWVETPNMASDNGRLFPKIGAEFEATGAVTLSKIGAAEARSFRTRELVDFARGRFEALL